MNPFFDKRFESIYQEYPLTLIDVGARGGIHHRWNPCKGHLKVIGFEPDELSFNELEATAASAKNHRYLNMALSDAEELKDFYITRRPHCSSFFKPNSKFLAKFPDADRWEILSTHQVMTYPLDQALEESDVYDADFLKLDTQGTELLILQGGRHAVNESIFGIEIEVEFSELYEGQPLFADVDQYLRSLGFVLFDMRTIDWKRDKGKYIGGRKGQMVFADALYLKSENALFENRECSKSKLLKSLTICAIYGYLDYALSLCEIAAQKNILDNAEYELLTRCITKPKHLATLWPGFRGRDRIANIIYAVYDIFRSRDWSHSGSSGRYLGNTGDPLIWG